MFRHLAVLAFLAAAPAGAIDLTTLPTNTWVETHPTYVGGTAGGAHAVQAWNNQAVYDPASQRVIVFDRWIDSVRSGSIYANALFAFDPVTEIVTVLKVSNWAVVSGVPCSECYATQVLPANSTDPTPVDRHPLGDLALDTERGRVVLSSGLNQSYADTGPWGVSDTWAFELASGQWSKVSDSSDSEQPQPYGVMRYDPANKVVVFFAGGTTVKLLDLGTGKWNTVTTPQGPAWISGGAAAYDSRRERILVFGRGWDSTSTSSELWAYSVSPNTWTRLPDCPEPAWGPGFDYDPNHDVFLALIGTHTWIYDPRANQWSQIDTPMPRIADMSAQPVIYDSAHDVFVFQGGNTGYAPPQWILFRYDGALFQVPDAGSPSNGSSAQHVDGGSPVASPWFPGAVAGGCGCDATSTAGALPGFLAVLFAWGRRGRRHGRENAR